MTATRNARVIQLLAAGLLAGGCYNPTFPQGILCSAEGECPAGQVCAADKRCYNPDEVPDGDGGVDNPDSGPPIDAPNGPIAEVSAAFERWTCALTKSGEVKCWGQGVAGLLGLGDIENIGDDELPSSVGFVSVGHSVAHVSTGVQASIALSPSGQLTGWGIVRGAGYPTTVDNNVGDDETPAMVGSLALPALKRAEMGGEATCVITNTDALRCFGFSTPPTVPRISSGRLEATDAPNIPLGGTPREVKLDSAGACVILANGDVKCWGAISSGALGLPGVTSIGDGDTPADHPPISLGEPAKALSIGNLFRCAILESGSVRCWGSGSSGRLGNQSTDDIGDDEVPSSAPVVDLGGLKAIQIDSGGPQTCVVLEDHTVRCWGSILGLGTGGPEIVGDDEPPVEIDIGAPVESVSVSGRHTCVVLLGGTGIKCWGGNTFGELGYGNTEVIGDDETPAAVGVVELGL